MVLGLEGLVDFVCEVVSLASELVDSYAERCESFKVHEEVVDEIAEPSVVVAPDNGTKRYTVFAAEGMIAHEGI